MDYALNTIMLTRSQLKNAENETIVSQKYGVFLIKKKYMLELCAYSNKNAKYMKSVISRAFDNQFKEEKLEGDYLIIYGRVKIMERTFMRRKMYMVDIYIRTKNSKIARIGQIEQREVKKEVFKCF